MTPTTLLIRELAELAPLFDRLRSEGLSRRKLTLPRRRLLMMLHHSGPTRSGELSQRIGVTPRAVTALVDGLVESGYVERRPDPTDRRATFIELTRAGVEVCRDMQSAFDDFATELFDGIDEDAVATAVGTVSTVRSNLERMLSSGTTFRK